jgi:erythromycin esterase-like protein
MAINSGEPQRAMDRVMFMATDPLKALGDIRMVRAYLDTRECEFVKRARQQQKSWAEIAASTGTSRHAAWERWQELDTST